MKKLLALLLTLAMVFSLAACGNKKDKPSGDEKNNTDSSYSDGENNDNPDGGSGSDGGGSVVTPDEEYNPYDPEQYIYRSVFANSPYKDQWDTGRSGAELDGIWDSSVLPDKVPEKPSTVTEVDRTELSQMPSSSAPDLLVSHCAL